MPLAAQQQIGHSDRSDAGWHVFACRHAPNDVRVTGEAAHRYGHRADVEHPQRHFGVHLGDGRCRHAAGPHQRVETAVREPGQPIPEAVVQHVHFRREGRRPRTAPRWSPRRPIRRGRWRPAFPADLKSVARQRLRARSPADSSRTPGRPLGARYPRGRWPVPLGDVGQREAHIDVAGAQAAQVLDSALGGKDVDGDVRSSGSASVWRESRRTPDTARRDLPRPAAVVRSGPLRMQPAANAAVARMNARRLISADRLLITANHPPPEDGNGPAGRLPEPSRPRSSRHGPRRSRRRSPTRGRFRRRRPAPARTVRPPSTGPRRAGRSRCH